MLRRWKLTTFSTYSLRAKSWDDLKICALALYSRDKHIDLFPRTSAVEIMAILRSKRLWICFRERTDWFSVDWPIIWHPSGAIEPCGVRGTDVKRLEVKAGKRLEIKGFWEIACEWAVCRNPFFAFCDSSSDHWRSRVWNKSTAFFPWRNKATTVFKDFRGCETRKLLSASDSHYLAKSW